MRRIILAGSAVLLIGSLCAPTLHPQGLTLSPSRVATPFELLSDFLVVVNGQVGDLEGLKFIVDTGATYTMIDRKVADRLQLRRRPGKVLNFDREVPAEWADLPKLRVGPLRTGPFRVLVAKLGEYSEFAENVDGIIGLDVLSRSRKLFIDYEKQTVSWELAGDSGPDASAGECYVMSAVVQGHPVHLILDTAFQGILLYKDRLSKGLPEVRTVGEATRVDLGRLQTTQVKLPGVRILGPETVATVFLMDGPEASRLPGIDGYLGIASLHAKRVEFDFVSRILRWQ